MNLFRNHHGEAFFLSSSSISAILSPVHILLLKSCGYCFGFGNLNKFTDGQGELRLEGMARVFPK